MKPILPGAIIGLLGGGQLGRMFALNARRMGYRVHTFDAVPDSPTGQISDHVFNFPYDDEQAIQEFARGVDVITYEFENIPATALDALAPYVPVRPGRDLLYIAQNRRREKEFLTKHGFPVVPYEVVHNAVELAAAVEKLGAPCILKTADFGYDGKGQRTIKAKGGEETIWREYGKEQGMVEKWIDFEAELSVIAARGSNGNIETFPISLNRHENHILAVSEVPGPFSPAVLAEAARIGRELARQFNLVGLLAVELFLTRDGKVLVNELAPRTHNSGHYSFDACLTSQFEQQLRAICDLPLGRTDLICPALMHNLLGDLWAKGEPDWAKLLELSGLRLHLYGKKEPRPGRKMGHYTILSDSIEKAREIDREAQAVLKS
jgi:5-(carboxyamino)imidazole ribonucleotide synthase